ncbi:MAG: acyltransferase [Chitinophagaceae bacterium]|nr:MAG: acyltransferase [Chitinophagaceae bacterium]
MFTLSDKTNQPAESGTTPRVDWVDFAKGFCIIMVVMLHSTSETEEMVRQEGFMRYLVTFAKPFRMPDFFLISGLFLARVIQRDWRGYLDRKVVHFFYFYALWVTVHFAVKLPGYVRSHELGAGALAYLEAFVQPLGTLWFIYQLPIFFVATKLLRRVPPALVFAVAAALEIAHINTGSIVVDQFASRFVYFFAGYWLAPKVFDLAGRVRARPLAAVLGLGAWALVNGALAFGGYGAKPFVSLLLGFAGAAAVVTLAVLLVNLALARPVRYMGEHSIVIYLAFFLPMHATLLVLVKTHLVTDVGMMALVITLASVLGALLLWWTVRHTRLSFLFARPARFRIDRPRAPLPARGGKVWFGGLFRGAGWFHKA